MSDPEKPPHVKAAEALGCVPFYHDAYGEPDAVWFCDGRECTLKALHRDGPYGSISLPEVH